MKLLKAMVVLSVVLGFGTVYADQSVPEKVTDKGRDVKRDVKAKSHRVEEKECDKNDDKNYAECMSKKIKNRSEEGYDAAKDKSTEMKDKADK